MQQVERHILYNRADLEEVCRLANNLYNATLFHIRQAYFSKLKNFSEYELSGLMVLFNNPDFRALPSNINQQIIKLVYQDWKSFWRVTKDYNKNPSKYKGKPKMPHYKKKGGLSACYIGYNNFRIKNGFIHFSKNVISPIKTNIVDAKQVRIIPQATCFIVEVVYETQIVDLNLNKDNFLSIDLGLNNIATCYNNVGQPFIINGKPLKSINNRYNKRKAGLQSRLPKLPNNGRQRHSSVLIDRITHKRNCQVQNFMHQSSREIVSYCIKNNIGTIIIGYNEGWKDEINLGSSTNQKFTAIPFLKLLEMIEYKAALVGITVKRTEESYTSKVDHLAGESMEHHETYLGNRKKRGLFISSTGKMLNADVNGCVGIARKVLGDLALEPIVHKGLGYRPVKINVLKRNNIVNKVPTI